MSCWLYTCNKCFYDTFQNMFTWCPLSRICSRICFSVSRKWILGCMIGSLNIMISKYCIPFGDIIQKEIQWFWQSVWRHLYKNFKPDMVAYAANIMWRCWGYLRMVHLCWKYIIGCAWFSQKHLIIFSLFILDNIWYYNMLIINNNM